MAHLLPRAPPMAMARGTREVLLGGFVMTFAALGVAAVLNRSSPRDGAVGRTASVATEPSAQELDRRRESSVQSSYLEKSATHFRILYEGSAQQAVGDHVARVLEREYWRVGRTLNSYPDATLTVTLYMNREFHDITRSPSWSIGNYDGQIRLAVGGALSSPGDLDRVATHELVHAIVAAAAPRHVPAWLNEGLATYLEAPDRSWAPAVLRRATDVVPLDALVKGFSGFDGDAALVAYAESATAAEILCTQLGANVGPFLQLIGNGRSLDDALLEFQVQPNAFHAEWRRRVGVQ